MPRSTERLEIGALEIELPLQIGHVALYGGAEVVDIRLKAHAVFCRPLRSPVHFLARHCDRGECLHGAFEICRGLADRHIGQATQHAGEDERHTERLPLRLIPLGEVRGETGNRLLDLPEAGPHFRFEISLPAPEIGDALAELRLDRVRRHGYSEVDQSGSAHCSRSAPTCCITGPEAGPSPIL